MIYSLSLKVPFPKNTIYQFFRNLDTFFRLNLQWTVLNLSNCKDVQNYSQFYLKIRDDRTDKEINYTGTIEKTIKDNLISICLVNDISRKIIIRLEDAGDNATMVYYEELIDKDLTLEEKRDISLWVKSVINYISISQKSTIRSKVYKWFIDKVWLKLSPTGRRVVFLVFIAEALAFLFFILLILWLLIFKKF